MIVGFSGTQKGMTQEQRQTLYILLDQYPMTAFHHGCCIGADDIAHDMVRTAFGQCFPIICHPSTNTNKIAPTFFRYVDDQAIFATDFVNSNTKFWKPEHPLARNKTLARECDILFATPYQPNEIVRSGTWATIRYFRKANKLTKVIKPDGTLLVSLVAVP